MNSNMEKIIGLVSQKLNIPEEKLKKSLEQGNIEGMIGDMKKEDAEKLKSIMNNPKSREKLLSSPEAENIMKKLKE